MLAVRSHSHLFLLLSWVGLLHPISSLAQSHEEVLDAVPEPATELFISADGQNRTVRQTPASVSIIDERSSEERGQQHVENVFEFVPNLNFAGGSNRARFFQIRGIGELERYEGAPNPSVGFIVDEFDLTGLGSGGSLFDVEQVEVLRGPQGLRYGTSGLAGLIHLRSTAPSVVPSARARLSAGSDDLLSGGVAFGGALPGTDDAILLRASAHQLRSDGFRRNEFLERSDTNEQNEFTGKLGLTLLASEKVTLDLRLLSIEQDNGYDIFTVSNDFTTRSDRPGRDEIDTDGVSLKASYLLSDAAELVSTTQFVRSDSLYSFDGDWGNNDFWDPFVPYDFFSSTARERKNIGQELRLRSRTHNAASAKWLMGLYGFRTTEDASIAEFFETEAYRDLQSDYRANHAAIFGEFDTPLTSSVSAVLGLRVENRDLRYTDSEGASFEPSSDTLIGGHISLRYLVDTYTTLYSTLSRGFKGGGFNSGTSIPSGRELYEPEYLTNFEVGLKGDYGDLSTSLAAFYGWRRDQQVRLALQEDPNDPLTFIYLADNADRSMNFGVEAEANLQVGPRLDLHASLGLLNTEFQNVPTELNYLEGRSASHAPAWQFATGARLNTTDRTFLRLDVTGKDEFYFDDSHSQKSAAYALLHASAGYSDSDFAITFWARNILDKEYATRGFFFGVEPPDFPERSFVQLGDPRQLGVTVDLFF
jgi:outer membrane receptor protein involved in Fe transport